MAYRKFSRRRARFTRRRRPTGTMGKIMSYAGKAMSFARRVAPIVRLLNAEKKYLDNTGSLITVPSTGATVPCFTLLQQGTSVGQRIGDSVKWISINARIDVTPHSASTVPNRVVLYLVIDTEAKGSLPAYSDLLQTVDTNSHLNVATLGRFKIMMRREFVVQTNVGAMPTMKVVLYKKRISVHTRYGTNTGAIGDIDHGSILLFALSDQSVNVPVMDYNVRLGYVDN